MDNKNDITDFHIVLFATHDYIKVLVASHMAYTKLDKHIFPQTTKGSTANVPVLATFEKNFHITEATEPGTLLNKKCTMGSSSCFVDTYTDLASGRLNNSFLKKKWRISSSADDPPPTRFRPALRLPLLVNATTLVKVKESGTTTTQPNTPLRGYTAVTRVCPKCFPRLLHHSAIFVFIIVIYPCLSCLSYAILFLYRSNYESSSWLSALADSCKLVMNGFGPMRLSTCSTSSF